MMMNQNGSFLQKIFGFDEAQRPVTRRWVLFLVYRLKPDLSPADAVSI
jgi:hypothetical protein